MTLVMMYCPNIRNATPAGHENVPNSIHEEDSSPDNDEEEADGKHADNDADNEEMH